MTILKNLTKKISFFDILSGLLIVFVLFVILIFFRREVKTIVVKVKVTDENPLYANTLPGNEFSYAFFPGDSENDELGRKISEIVSVDKYMLNPDRQVVYLNLKIKTTYNPRKKTYTYLGKTIAFGESYNFTFSKVRFTGLVVDFPGFQEGSKKVKRTRIVNTQLRWDNREFSDTYGVPNYIADSIKEGLFVKNSSNEILAVIRDVKIAPAKRTIITNYNQPISVLDPELKDVFYDDRTSNCNYRRC
jgi:hypothetical protein